MVRGRKKRRVWWIMGAVCFVVLFFVTTILFSRNSPDARLERVLSQIIAQYGFEHESNDRFGMLSFDGPTTRDVYKGAPLSQEDDERIRELLKGVCTRSIAGRKMIMCTGAEGSDILFVEIRLDFVERQYLSDETSESRMIVKRATSGNLWSFLTNLWPW